MEEIEKIVIEKSICSMNSRDRFISKHVEDREMPLTKDRECPTCTQKIFEPEFRQEMDIVRKFEHLVLGR